MYDEELPQAPWTCRWGHFGGTVKASASIESPDVFWACLRPGPTPGLRLFARDKCEKCVRWEPRARFVRSTRADAALRELALEHRPLPGVAMVRRYAKGDALFREGASPDLFYTIVSGRVKVFKLTPSGREVIVEIIGAGEPIGAAACYDGRLFPASAIALEDTTCVAVPRQAFLTLLEQHPSLALGLLRGLSQRLIDLTNRVAELTGSRVEPRFAGLFLKLAHEVGRTERDGIHIPMSLSRQQLADLTGTTIETCIRVMNRWERQGIVRTEKNGFVVVDRKTIDVLSGSAIVKALPRKPTRRV